MRADEHAPRCSVNRRQSVAPARDDVVVVVPVPLGDDGWLVTVTDLDGEPIIVHTVRCALSVSATVVLVAPVGTVHAVADNLTRAGLGQVFVTDGRPGPGQPADLASVVARAVATADGRPAGGPPETGKALLVHDPLCPLTPASHLLDVLDRARTTDGSYIATAGVHPVTDTVKTVSEDGEGFAVAGTVDREDLRVVTSPVVVPITLAGLVPASSGVVELVRLLRGHTDVELVTAPPIARRVHDRPGLHLVMGLREVEELRGRSKDREGQRQAGTLTPSASGSSPGSARRGEGPPGTSP